MPAEQRKLKNLPLTGHYYWPYVGRWLTFTLGLCFIMEVLVLATLHTVRHNSNSALPLEQYAVISVAVTVSVMLGIAALGRLWAHRIAGVHLRTEQVLRKVAGGDREVELRYRSRDRLEDVEEAFANMMAAISEGRVNRPGPEETSQESQARGRRGWRNLRLTSKHHISYMAVWLFLCLGLLIACYGNLVFYFYIRYYLTNSSLPDPTVFTVLASLLVFGLCLFVFWRGFLTAHRLAGVHIRLAQVFNEVASGKPNVTLKFRSYDRLEALEQAFQDMMESFD